jgi:hypothetical protein
VVESQVARSEIGFTHLCAVAFGIDIYDYQETILKAAFTCRKITIRATTRAGKSYCMAIVAIMRAITLPNHTVGIIAPTHDKTRIIMNYIAELLASNPMFDELVMVSTEGLTKLERLRKEVSKKRITFRNGSSIQCLSVDLDSRGFGVMGWGFSTVIVDESDMIDDESYVKIFRMLLERTENSCLIEIGNPFSLSHFYRHHHDPDWEKIHISAEDCIRVGRLTREAVEEQRKEMTELEAKVLLDADFPDELEYAIFPKQAIENMTRQKEIPKHEKIIIGIDPAAGGRDLTVITPFKVIGGDYYQEDGLVLDTRDAMAIVGKVQEFIRERYPLEKVEIGVDCVNNRGILDRLKENGYTTHEFIAGKKARNHTRFFNYKTEVAFKVAELAKEGHIWNVPAASRYVLQLRAWTYEIRSDKQLKVIDPEEKSPDFADSLIIALACDIYHDVAFAEGLTGLRPPMHRGFPKARDRLAQR